MLSWHFGSRTLCIRMRELSSAASYARWAARRILFLSSETRCREKDMRGVIGALSIAAALSRPSWTSRPEKPVKPTIVLVHGAFADSASWNAVITELNLLGFKAIAAANPLRSLAGDAAAVASVVRSIAGPVVLVGHSYGGPVITEAANSAGNVTALVYVAGFAPEAGESSLALSQRFPGSTLADALTPVALPNGGQDLYIDADKFHEQFAADVPSAEAALMAATQRPVTSTALSDASGAPSWKKLPSYMIYGTADRNIPPAAIQFMAERAHAREIVAVEGASHALMVSHPAMVASLIDHAATAA